MGKLVVTLKSMVTRYRYWFLGLLIFVLVIFVVIHALKGPSQGTIIKNLAQQPSDSDTRQASSYTQYEGLKARFSYPDYYRFKKNEDIPVSVSESYILTAPGQSNQPTWNIAITVYVLPGNSMEDNSSYKIRSDQPAIYEKTDQKIGDFDVVYFKKKNSNEMTAFFKSGVRLASIGMDNINNNPTADRDFNYLISSWQWK